MPSAPSSYSGRVYIKDIPKSKISIIEISDEELEKFMEGEGFGSCGFELNDEKPKK